LIGGNALRKAPYESSYMSSSLVARILLRKSPLLLESKILYVLARIAMMRLSKRILNAITIKIRYTSPNNCMSGGAYLKIIKLKFPREALMTVSKD